MSVPQFIIVGGANGSGKSTCAPALFPPSVPYINADEIAKTLTVEPASRRDRQASRLLLEQCDTLAAERRDFGIETTLSSRSLFARIQRLQAVGYQFHLLFFFLESPDLAVARVAERVRHGGHDIPEDTIRRRYTGGIRNLFDLYLPLAHIWRVYDNTKFYEAELVAKGGQNADTIVEVATVWRRIRRGNE